MSTTRKIEVVWDSAVTTVHGESKPPESITPDQHLCHWPERQLAVQGLFIAIGLISQWNWYVTSWRLPRTTPSRFRVVLREDSAPGAFCCR